MRHGRFRSLSRNWPDLARFGELTARYVTMDTRTAGTAISWELRVLSTGGFDDGSIEALL